MENKTTQKPDHKPEESDHLTLLISSLTVSQNEETTLSLFTEWLLKTTRAIGCGYASIRSAVPTGINWGKWEPDDFLGESARSIDFNNYVLRLINLNEPTFFNQESICKIDPVLNEWVSTNQIHWLLLIPIYYEKDVDRVFILAFQDQQGKNVYAQKSLLSSAAKLISNIIKWQRKTREAEKKIVEQDKMLQASLSLTASLNLEDVLNSILKNALDMIPGANDVHIFLYENELLNFGAAMHQNGSVGKVWANPRKNGLTYTVARSGEIIIVPDIHSHPLFQSVPNDWSGSIIGVPLKYGNVVLGVMTMAKLKPNSFTDQEINIVKHLANQAANVVKNVRTHDLIMLQAYTDPLTGLPNRRSFEWEANKILEHSSRYEHCFTVAMLDLDGFKRINDTYGHTIGDESLRIIAHCLRNAVRKTDFLARFGGDEFILLLPETDKTYAFQVVKKIIDRMTQCRLPVAENHYEILGISFGIATFPHDADDLLGLIQIADNNLYENKRRLE